jgi:hypothetical protein
MSLSYDQGNKKKKEKKWQQIALKTKIEELHFFFNLLV